MLPQISQEEEREFPYWFAVFELEPYYRESDPSICFHRWEVEDIRSLEELSEIASTHEGVIEIVECSDDDPVAGSDDEDDCPGIYFYVLQMRFKSPLKLNEAFHALSGFIPSDVNFFATGKYPAHFDDHSDSIDFATAYALALVKAEIQSSVDMVQGLYLN